VYKISENIYRVWVDITNPKTAPTILRRVAPNNVVRPDILHFEGQHAEIISASWIGNKEIARLRRSVAKPIDQKNLNRIMIRDGHPGKTTRTIQYLVKGSGKIVIAYDSVKGGGAKMEASLR